MDGDTEECGDLGVTQAMVPCQHEDLPTALGQFGDRSVDGPAQLLGFELTDGISFVLGMLATFDKQPFMIAFRLQIVDTPVTDSPIQVSAHTGSRTPLLP